MNMYHLQRQDRTRPEAPWEPIESGWECDNQFSDEALAQAAARTIALRHDGTAAVRVVSDAGEVLAVVIIEKHLRIATYSSSLRGVSERIPPDFDVPMLSDVLADDTVRARVFFRIRKRRKLT